MDPQVCRATSVLVSPIRMPSESQAGAIAETLAVMAAMSPGRPNALSEEDREFLDVLDTQRTMLAAETQLAQTERARLTDMVSLYKALGGGWHAPGDGSAATSQGSAAR